MMKLSQIIEMGRKLNDSLCKRQILCLSHKKLLDSQHHHPPKRGWGGRIVFGHPQSQETTILGSSAEPPCRRVIQSRLDRLPSIVEGWEGSQNSQQGIQVYVTLFLFHVVLEGLEYIGQEDWGRLYLQLWLWGNTPFYWIRTFQIGPVVGGAL